MKYFFILAGLCLGPAGPASAETFTLKNGGTLEAQEISPEGDWLRLRLAQGEVFIPKSDLTAEQAARYFSSADGKYLTFETRIADGEITYVYFDRGRETGRRVLGGDGALLRTEGAIADGSYREFYPGDGVEKSVTIINGRQSGAFRVYFPGGRTQSETYFLNDARHGPSRVFDEQGNIISEENFLYGVRQQDGGAAAPAAGGPGGEAPAPERPGKPRRPARLFFAVEGFTVGGADSKWRSGFKASEAALAAGGVTTDGSIKTYPGYGARAGLNFGGFLSPFSLAYSFVAGPSSRSRIRLTAAGAPAGERKQELRTFYQRVMAELKVPLLTVGNDSLDLRAGAGRAFGRIVSETRLSGPAFAGAPERARAAALWSGPAYDFGLSVTSRSAGGGWLELGARYSVLPAKQAAGDWDSFSWSPVSGYLSLAF